MNDIIEIRERADARSAGRRNHFDSPDQTNDDRRALLALLDAANEKYEAVEGKVLLINETLQALGEQYGCPTGIKRMDWVAFALKEGAASTAREKRLREALEWIEYHYANQDMSHLQFRVEAHTRALIGLEDTSNE